MAIDSFKKVLWEAAVISEFRKTSVADLISTRPVKTDGTKVVFNKLKTSDVKDYTGSVDWGEVATEPVELLFDKKKYWAVTMEDLDEVQSQKDLMVDIVTDETAKIREVEDTDFLATASKGAKSLVKTPVALNAKNVYDSIVDLGTALSKSKAPKKDRYVVVNAEVLGLLAKDDRFTRNPSVLENGIVEGQLINTMQVVQCEELPTGTILAMHKSAIGFGRCFEKVEAMRLQNAFADGVRGLDNYGSVVLRPEAATTLKYTLEAPQA
ncbi:Uncharacterised protein [Clostridium perfringens]|uniref:hypothetical protein n=1 Tax=Clostridium perfringens TaxID=1502 RepID=UPI000E136153|nr:hypothetical protein [Clostridium perfringens]SUY33284.1 Uncharacterised protein [Clostridium perfringens]